MKPWSERFHNLTSFVGTWVTTLAVFVAVAFVVAVGHQVITDQSFSLSWRWVHDSTILPSNLVLCPLVGLLLLLRKSTRWGYALFERAPRAFHWLVFLVLSIFFANAISQAAGGCVWFVFTEGWWVRFGHGWLLPDHKPVPDSVVAGIDIVLAIVGGWVAFWYHQLYFKNRVDLGRLR